MLRQEETITPRHTLADLAATRAGASRVFQRHGLDFCCHGNTSLADACSAGRIDVEGLIREIEAEERETADGDFTPWNEQAIPVLIDHILERYHAPLREEFPRLRAMAEKVESVHAEKPSCPTGLAAQILRLEQELEDHMQKEEQVLFPMLRAGRGAMARMPIQVMEQEHRDAGELLAGIRRLATDFQPPEEACGTWRALYLGLGELERELMQHIHLENYVLFPRALRD